jgi:ATP-dependent DNA helicase HFM1/MER3
MLQDREFREQQQGKAALQQSAQVSKDEPEESDVYSDLLDLFDMPAAVDQESFVSKKAPITSETPAQPTKVMEEEFKQVPESFKDLQPWLFQEFGDIVELVNE